jgi:hypothetical protein
LLGDFLGCQAVRMLKKEIGDADEAGGAIAFDEIPLAWSDRRRQRQVIGRTAGFVRCGVGDFRERDVLAVAGEAEAYRRRDLWFSRGAEPGALALSGARARATEVSARR